MTDSPARHHVASTHPQLAPVLTLVGHTLQACAAYGRPDLSTRLLGTQELLANPGTHVVVCGEFKQGKSSLVNALANTNLCPVDDDVATAVPTFVRWGAEPSAEASVFAEDPTVAPRREPVPLSELSRHIVEAPAANELAINRVDLRLPEPVLQSGLVLVDTPGVGGLGSVHAAATLAAIPLAEAVIFVSDASQEFTETEVEFLERARALCPRLLCVLTKIDLYPEWRKIHELNQAHLLSRHIDVDLLAVSAVLRVAGRSAGDEALEGESGLAAIDSFLQSQVSIEAVDRSLHGAISELLAITPLLKAPFESEQAALSDPAAAGEIVRQLEQTKAEAEQLRSSSSRWSTALNDGVSDLMSDVDHDFRGRVRRIVEEANATIDDHDPRSAWSEFEPWFQAKVSEEVLANYHYLQLRSGELSDVVAAYFQDASGTLTDHLAQFDPTPAMSRVADVQSPTFERKGAAGRGFSAVRGGQSGMMMFRTLAGFVAVGLSPLGLPMLAMSFAASLFTGRNALSEEKKRELAQHRSLAKAAARKYTDDVSFVVGKDLQATMRQAQRDLRDHYTARAEELHRSTAEAVASATRAAQQTSAEAQARLKDVNAELARLGQLEASISSASQALSARA